MKDGKVLWITTAAVFIAVTVCLQALTLQLGNQFVTGSVVNMMLILAVMSRGLPIGMTVGVISPILPTLMGFGPLPPIVPFIMMGNAALVSVWHFVGNGKLPNKYASYIIATAAGAFIKFGILYIGVVKIAAPYILNVPDGHPITVMFSVPQLITASIGGALAIAVLPVVKKALPRKSAG